MRVAVSAVGQSLDSQVDPRFGRCSYFIIVDTETMKYDVIPNESQYMPSGAGIQAAQRVVNSGVGAVLTGNVGPNAFQALSAAGIEIFTGAYGTVRNAVEQFKKGLLRKASSPIRGGFGMGMGRGMGGGRGMRRMGGMISPPAPMPQLAPPVSPPPLSKDEEIKLLERQMEDLERRLNEIKRRLKELGSKR